MAEEKEKRLNRFTKEEESLIRNTFKDREDLLKTLRKFFLQFPLDAVDQSLLEVNCKNKELLKVIRRRFLPEVEADLPFSTLTKQVDQFTVIPVNQLMAESVVGHIKAMDRFRQYMEQQLKILESGKFTTEPKMKLRDMTKVEGKGDTDLYLDIFARNQVLEQVEQQLLLLDLKANERELTKDELDDMRRKNSNK
jgi:hypothetical protein